VVAAALVVATMMMTTMWVAEGKTLHACTPNPFRCLLQQILIMRKIKGVPRASGLRRLFPGRVLGASVK
jgi:hypothetical protein